MILHKAPAGNAIIIRMKITFFEVPENERVLLAAELTKHPELEAEFTSEKLTSANASRTPGADAVSVFIHSIVDKDVIDALPRGVKLIATRSTGFDHIDREYATSKGVSVANVPAYGSHTVAEFAFALILGLSRKIFEASFRIKSGQKYDESGLRGFDLYGKTMGVIGTGRIGQNAARIARGFGMNVVAYDVFPDAEAAGNIGFEYVPLDELLSRADVVSMHVPFNKDTKHMINRQNISKFKPGALFINTARGEVCESEALIEGLEKNILGGVGLDVVEGERSLKEGGDVDAFTRLIRHPKAFVTPHMAYYTVEAQAEISRVTVENILAFANKAPKNVI